MSQYSSTGRAWEKKRQEVLEMYGWECVGLFPEICERTENLQVDHIIPKSKHGTDEMDNLRVLCRRCNSRKKDRLDTVERTWFSSKYFSEPVKRPLKNAQDIGAK